MYPRLALHLWPRANLNLLNSEVQVCKTIDHLVKGFFFWFLDTGFLCVDPVGPPDPTELSGSFPEAPMWRIWTTDPEQLQDRALPPQTEEPWRTERKGPKGVGGGGNARL